MQTWEPYVNLTKAITHVYDCSCEVKMLPSQNMTFQLCLQDLYEAWHFADCILNSIELTQFCLSLIKWETGTLPDPDFPDYHLPECLTPYTYFPQKLTTENVMELGI